MTYSYTYNKAGNILSKTVNNGTPITYTYGDANGWKDLLTGYNGHTISYDAIGNPTTWYDNAQMSWVNGRRLESISAVSGVHSAMSFTYNSDGLRLTKTVGTGNSAVEHRYTWQGGNLISEYWGDGKRLEFYYGPEGSIDGFNYKAGPNSSVYVYYYVKNLQGDVVAIINKDGELRAQYTYDPFGKVLSATGTMADINPIRYRGYYYDAESGFYYLQSRYYDPNLCRFINADGLASTGQGFIGCNMFAYCLNNPIISSDNNGAISFFSVCLFDDVINFQIVDYVIVYYNQNSQLNLDGQAYGQQYSSEAIYVDVSSYSDFVNAMKNIPSRHVNNIYLYLHSDYDNEKEDYRFVFYYAKYSYAENILSDISPISIQGDIYLFSCHGANLAPSLAQATGKNVVASYEGVSFSSGYARIGNKDYFLSWLYGDDTRGWWSFSPSGEAKQLTQGQFFYGG